MRRNSPLMIEFLWCLVIPTWSPVWNKITKDMKSINTQSATLRVIHTSARMFSDFYKSSGLSWPTKSDCFARIIYFACRTACGRSGEVESKPVSRRPAWCGDLWKQFIYWWLLSPRYLRITFRVQDCVKLKPQVASKPNHLGFLFTIRSPRTVVLCMPLIYVVSS